MKRTVLAAAIAGALISPVAYAAIFSLEGELQAALAAVRADDMAAVALHAKAVHDIACARLVNEGKPNPVGSDGQWVCPVVE